MTSRGTIRECDYFREDAIRGSLKLRNALFKLAGYQPPSRAGRPRKRVSAPVFNPPPKPDARRGKPKGWRKPLYRIEKIERIQFLVARRCRIRVENLRSDRRAERMTRARHIAMYLARKETGESYPSVAFNFGRDHTTVVYAVAKVQEMVGAGDQYTLRVINDVLGSLRA